MNKIVQIVLINFQYHKKLVINIEKGFNCITGNNNKGKSSVIRAINWVITNSPRGDWMRKRTKKNTTLTTTVKIIFDDGTVVKRVKGKDKNYYVVNGKEFHDFTRTGIPKDIMDVFALDAKMIEAIDVHPNIDMQDDEPFLVYDKTTTKAVAINLITGASVIEDSIKSYNKDRLEHSRDITYNNKVIKETKESLKRYDVLKDVNLKPVKKKIAKLQKHCEKIEKLKQLKNEYTDYSNTIKEYSAISVVYKDILQVEHEVDDLIQMQPIYDRLVIFKARLIQYDHVRTPPAIDFDKIQDDVQVIDKIDVELSKLIKLRDSYIEHNMDCQISEKQIKQLKQELDKYNNSKCPLCGNKIKKLI